MTKFEEFKANILTTAEQQEECVFCGKKAMDQFHYEGTDYTFCDCCAPQGTMREKSEHRKKLVQTLDRQIQELIEKENEVKPPVEIPQPEVDVEGLTNIVISMAKEIFVDMSDRAINGIKPHMMEIIELAREIKQHQNNIMEIKIDKKTIKTANGTVMHERLPAIMGMVKAGLYPFLVGSAGTGKSHVAETIAEALELKYYFVNAVQDRYELVGYKNAQGEYVETSFYNAYKHGGLFFFDEVDASNAEALITINMALANKFMAFPHEQVPMHENFKCICAGNTKGTGSSGGYVRNKLDGATLDRFTLISFDYDKKIETLMAGGDKDLVENIRALRKILDKMNSKHILSTRAIAKVVSLRAIKSGEKQMLSEKEIFEIAILNAMPLNERNGFKTSVENQAPDTFKGL